MTRLPFVLLLMSGLAFTPVAETSLAACAEFDTHAVAAADRTVPAAGARPQFRCHDRDGLSNADPRELLVRVAAAALRVVAQVLRLPGWSGAALDHDPSWSGDLQTSLDALWTSLVEASRTSPGSKGNRP